MPPALLRSIRRYPVKTMGGEPLEHVSVATRGLEGDRSWGVLTADGRFASGKNSRVHQRCDGMFGYRATTSANGDVTVVRERRLVDGPGRTSAFVPDPAGPWTVDDPALLADLRARLDEPVTVVRASDAELYDSGTVSLIGSATVAWAAQELGADAADRRLRANLVVTTTEPFEEESWIGGRVRIGAVEFAVERRIQRCRMIDLDQDGLPERAAFLQGLASARGPFLAVYLQVLRPGDVAIGDEVDVCG